MVINNRSVTNLLTASHQIMCLRPGAFRTLLTQYSNTTMQQVARHLPAPCLGFLVTVEPSYRLSILLFAFSNIRNGQGASSRQRRKIFQRNQPQVRFRDWA